jgi:predicted RNA methylase
MESKVLPLITICISLFCLAAIVTYTLVNGIPPMPTPPSLRKIIIDILAELKPRGTLYELGSGWGNLAMAMAKSFPRCTIHAMENSPIPYIFSTAMNRIASPGNLRIFRGNIFNADLQDASIVICYLSRKHMEKLKVKFTRELPRGAKVISNTFSIPGWEPVRRIQAGDLYKTFIYLYSIDTVRTSVEFNA